MFLALPPQISSHSDRTRTWEDIKHSAKKLEPFTSVDIDNLDCPESGQLSGLKGDLAVLTLYSIWETPAPDLYLLAQGYQLRFLITKYALLARDYSEQADFRALAVNQELASVFTELSQRQRFNGPLKKLQEWNHFLDFIFQLYSGLETETEASSLKQKLELSFAEWQLSPPDLSDSLEIWTGITFAVQLSSKANADVPADLRAFVITLLLDLMRNYDSFEDMVRCYRMQAKQDATEWLLARLRLWMNRELGREDGAERSPWGVFYHDHGVFRPDDERAQDHPWELLDHEIWKNRGESLSHVIHVTHLLSPRDM